MSKVRPCSAELWLLEFFFELQLEKAYAIDGLLYFSKKKKKKKKSKCNFLRRIIKKSIPLVIENVIGPESFFYT